MRQALPAGAVSTTRLSTPRPTASAEAAASGGTAAVARTVSECPATCPMFPATDTASPASVTTHAADRCRVRHWSTRAIEQRELADRDKDVDLQRPDSSPYPGEAVTVRPQVQAAVGLGEAHQGGRDHEDRDQGERGRAQAAEDAGNRSGRDGRAAALRAAATRCAGTPDPPEPDPYLHAALR